MMKRDAEGKAKSQSMAPVFNPVKTYNSSDGRWDSEDGQLWIYTSNDCQGRVKVAGFDMDATLIVTKSGHVFPKDTTDWKLIYDSVPKTIKELYADGFKVVIFSNQKGITVGKVDKAGFRKKIESIVVKIGVPMQVFLSLGDGEYRKPATGMWKAMTKRNDDVEVDVASSFFVGDAAGRHKTKARWQDKLIALSHKKIYFLNRQKKDHSLADRFFAHNCGLTFHTPEQFFLSNKTHEPWGPPSFEPKNLFHPDRRPFEPETKIPSEKSEIIVLCGFPGSGKSTFARKVAEEHGYAVVNRDTLGTWQKCLAQAEGHLKDGKSVIVDNTNPDEESRKRYIDLAKRLGVSCRCFELNCSFDHARHNVRFRVLTENRANEVNTMVLRIFQKKFTAPMMTEGFDSVIKVNPIPDFQTEEHRHLYMQYLVE